MSVLQRQWGRSRVLPAVRDTHLLGVVFAKHGVSDGLLTGLYIWVSTGNVFEANPVAAHATNWFFWEVALEHLHGEPWLWTGLFFLATKVALVGGLCLLTYRYLDDLRSVPGSRLFLGAAALSGVVLVLNNLAAVV